MGAAEASGKPVSFKLKVDISACGKDSGSATSETRPDATVPWSFLSDKKGNVQGASFTCSEGSL
jgi:hypothetical protein